MFFSNLVTLKKTLNSKFWHWFGMISSQITKSSACPLNCFVSVSEVPCYIMSQYNTKMFWVCGTSIYAPKECYTEEPWCEGIIW